MTFMVMLRRPKFEVVHWSLRSPKARGRVDYHAGTADGVQASLEAAGIGVSPLRVEPREYQDYVDRADYAQFGAYYALDRPSFAEKSLEHFLAARLLSLRPGNVYVDVASDTSPAPDIYARLFGVKSYRQDLRYARGVKGNRIGGDAAAMPVGDCFADAMALHCSFEHFEGDSDSRFVAECSRVLRPGGRVCCLPLYLSTRYSVMTDPDSLGWFGRPEFEPDATIHSTPGYGQRHGRFYDAAHLRSRVLDKLGGLTAMVYRVTNLEEIAPTCYLQFALLIEKPIHA